MPFPRCLGLLRRGPAQGPRPDRYARPWGRLSRPLLFGRLFPTFLHSATDLLDGFVRCRLFRVSGTRSKPLNQEDSING